MSINLLERYDQGFRDYTVNISANTESSIDCIFITCIVNDFDRVGICVAIIEDKNISAVITDTACTIKF